MITDFHRRLSLVSPQSRIEKYEQQLEMLKSKADNFVNEKISRADSNIKATAAKLESINPIAVLSRGYVIAEKDGQVISSKKQLSKNDEFSVEFSDGKITAKAIGE